MVVLIHKCTSSPDGMNAGPENLNVEACISAEQFEFHSNLAPFGLELETFTENC